MNRSLARFPSLFVISLFVLTITGCLGDRNWQYPPQSSGTYLETKATKPIPARVVVLPFEDLRGNNVKDEYWKAAIPLVLYGDLEYDRPEEVEGAEKVDQVHFHPTTDFAQATASELRESGVFSSVEFAEKGEPPPADLHFNGRIRSTNWERRLYTYFVGPFASILWMLGIPMGESTTGLVFDLRLSPADDPSTVVWEMSMDYERKKWDSPYYNLEAAVQSYPEALQEALRPAVADLVNLADQDPTRIFPGKQ